MTVLLTEQELIEALADKEHASWARWMEYLFSKCRRTTDGMLIPLPYARHWKQEVKTPYADLPEAAKQSDRDEVAHILPLILEARKAELYHAMLLVEHLGGASPEQTNTIVALAARMDELDREIAAASEK